mmetsp:Transcript_1873/g.1941  ORF Transcript_1873/g.1941 Transcript_1873/m.1941 type:complete len:511 (+) Transcript_1873:178-1710(+)|eukprot:gene1176-1248_t
MSSRFFTSTGSPLIDQATSVSIFMNSNSFSSRSSDFTEVDYERVYAGSVDSEVFDKYYDAEGRIELRNKANHEFSKLSPRKSFSKFFLGIPPADACRRLLPLMLVLERQQSKSCFEAKITAFYKWKKYSLQIERGMDLSDNLEILKRLADSRVISEEDLADLHRKKIYDSLDKLCYGLQLMHRRNQIHRSNFSSDLFHHWRQVAKVLKVLDKVTPLALKVFCLLDYDMLWIIFCSYCTDKRQIPGEAKVLSPSHQRQPKSPPPSMKNDHVVVGNNSPFPPSVTGASSVPMKYRKRIVSSENIWNFFKDCRVCPVVLSKRSLETYILDVHESDVSLPHGGSCQVNYFSDDIVHVRKSIAKKTPVHLLFPAPPSLSSTSSHNLLHHHHGKASSGSHHHLYHLTPTHPASDSRRSDSSPVTTVPSVESKPAAVEKMMSPSQISQKAKHANVSFHTFLKLCWRIVGECLNRNLSVEDIVILRQLIDQNDRVAKKQASLINTLDDWMRFLAFLRK